MGYIAPAPPPQEFEGYTETLYTLARIYDIGHQFLAPRKTPVQRAVEYGRQMWADRHVEALGWGLLASVFGAVLLIAAMFR